MLLFEDFTVGSLWDTHSVACGTTACLTKPVLDPLTDLKPAIFLGVRQSVLFLRTGFEHWMARATSFPYDADNIVPYVSQIKQKQTSTGFMGAVLSP